MGLRDCWQGVAFSPEAAGGRLFARNVRLDEPDVTGYLRDAVDRTFDEDKDMLEPQERNIGDVAEPQFAIAVKADVGPTQGRRLLASLIEAESRGA